MSVAAAQKITETQPRRLLRSGFQSLTVDSPRLNGRVLSIIVQKKGEKVRSASRLRAGVEQHYVLLKWLVGARGYGGKCVLGYRSSRIMEADEARIGVTGHDHGIGLTDIFRHRDHRIRFGFPVQMGQGLLCGQSVRRQSGIRHGKSLGFIQSFRQLGRLGVAWVPENQTSGGIRSARSGL